MSKTRAFASQEKEFQARRMGKLGRGLLMSLATALSFVAIGLLAADQLYRPDTFVISELKIKGKFAYMQAADIEAVVVEQELGNFFSIKLDEIKAKVEEMAWVQRADVRREWPDSLSITVVEHQPAMRWGKRKWVSTAGVVLSLPNKIKAPNTIVLHGSEPQAKRILLHAAKWRKDLLAFGLIVKAVRLSDSEAWTLSLRYDALDSDFELILGHQDVSERLDRFKTLFTSQLMFSEYRLERIDARYPDGLAVEQGKSKLTNETGATELSSMTVAISL